MNRNFVPEMHDLGKLAVSQIAASDHSFAKVDWKKFAEPKNPTWYGIRYHMSPEEIRDLKSLFPPVYQVICKTFLCAKGFFFWF